MTSPYKLRFINHACIAIENDEHLMLVDPWFMSRVFNDSWALLDDRLPDTIDYQKLTHIFYTHEHPDHLNWPTLKYIRAQTTNDSLWLIGAPRTNSNVADMARQLGYRYAELVPHLETSVTPGFSIATSPAEHSHDSVHIYRLNEDTVVLNQNDCWLSDRQAEAIKGYYVQKYSGIDVFLSQFGLAGYYGNRDDLDVHHRARKAHIELLRRHHEIFSPRILVPFASYIYFCKKHNDFLNDQQVRPGDLRSYFSDSECQYVRCGDEILLDGWEKNNDKNIKEWETLLDEIPESNNPRKLEEDTLLDICDKFTSEYTSGPLGIAYGDLYINFFDHDRTLKCNFNSKKFSFVEKSDAPSWRIAGILPTEEWEAFLKFPWGADTLNITSCFDKTNPELWNKMIQWRDGLYNR